MSERIVLVGAGQAAQSVIETLRKEGFSGRILLIGEEPVPPYQRPPLSKKYLLGDMSRERLFLRPESYFADHDVTLELGRRVERIAPTERQIELSDGRLIGYDKLVLTTGSHARTLPAAMGRDLIGLHTVRTLADIDRMAPECQPGKKVLVLGGGYIGLEAAAVLVQRGLSVTLVEMAPRLLARVAGEPTAAFFHALHESRGVRLLTGTGLEAFEDQSEGPGRVRKARLSDGSVLDIDFAVLGIGIAPNDGLALAAGLDVDNGILVDAQGRTSDAHIYAAGDCTRFDWHGQSIRLESVQNAIDQGAVVARSLLGQDVSYAPVPWFWSDQYEIKLQIAGLSTGHDRVVIRPGRDALSQSVWYFAGAQLLAVDAMSDPRAYMMGKRWLEQGVSPDPERLGDATQDLKTLIV
ncbi:MAG: FAD-dependent oxidoreductase [Neomegalonema sp.]|nr:FAD-dependent oxidoreductase [Neomegalonema sp.]